MLSVVVSTEYILMIGKPKKRPKVRRLYTLDADVAAAIAETAESLRVSKSGLVNSTMAQKCLGDMTRAHNDPELTDEIEK